MSKVLWIAGHGKNLNNGYFDSGATGFITKGEHKYYVENVFPRLKYWLHEDDKEDSIFHTDYNVYSHNNIVQLAKTYGEDTIVIECHYDAVSNPNVKGGHVIIYGGFEPDKVDLALRDVIANHIGLAYPIHKGQKGISGRTDLRNPNASAYGGVNYRLIELGFGTSKHDADIMVNEVDSIAKSLIKAVYGRVRTDESVTSDNLYRVQVGAYKQEVNALRKEKELQALGQDTYIIQY